MNRGYHPDYEKLALRYEERIDSRRIIRRTGSHKPKPPDFTTPEVQPRELELSTKTFWIIPIVIIIGIIAIWYFYSEEKLETEIPFLIPTAIEDISSENAIQRPSNEREFEIMKEVLNNLAITVEKLSRENQKYNESKVVKDEENASSTLTITSYKAHLREKPSKFSDSLAIVLKGTVLISNGSYDGWIKTFAPNGKEAWVHSSITTKGRTNDN